MENLRGNYNNPKTPAIKYFDGNVLPISIGRSRFHAPIPLSPIFDPYELSENPNSPNPLSPLVQCLRSGSSVPFDGSGGGSRSSGGRGGFGSPLASIENLLTQPSGSPITVFKTPVKVEEDVIVMDGILVKPKNGSARSRATTPSDSSGEKSFYKRDTCWFWEESGTCRLGSKCQFAHGLEELRPARPTTKVNKSEICKSFNLGSCSYGTKCRFVHHQGQVNSTVLSPAAKVAFPAKLGPVTPIEVKHPASGGNSSTSATAIGNTGWSPQDDSIETFLPGKAPTKEDVDAYIHSVLYGPSRRKRLPVFVEICPE